MDYCWVTTLTKLFDSIITNLLSIQAILILIMHSKMELQALMNTWLFQMQIHPCRSSIQPNNMKQLVVFRLDLEIILAQVQTTKSLEIVKMMIRKRLEILELMHSRAPNTVRHW